jgi:methylenetetrahydrofolate dehydrogenase (NADP+)/methenyltetrahydrofolate cyclohydrolase
MSAKIIDGNGIAKQIRRELADEVRALRIQGVTPGLAVILVGDDPASLVYVGKKVKACSDVGIASRRYRFPADVSPQRVYALIDELNADPAVHGILVQLPLPRQFNLRTVLEAISPAKDVDGFHVYNVGALVVGENVFRSGCWCTRASRWRVKTW